MQQQSKSIVEQYLSSHPGIGCREAVQPRQRLIVACRLVNGAKKARGEEHSHPLWAAQGQDVDELHTARHMHLRSPLQ